MDTVPVHLYPNEVVPQIEILDLQREGSNVDFGSLLTPGPRFNTWLYQGKCWQGVFQGSLHQRLPMHSMAHLLAELWKIQRPRVACVSFGMSLGWSQGPMRSAWILESSGCLRQERI